MKARRAASIALAALLLLGTTGCTLFAIQGTTVRYQPSDGTAADVGELKLRNVIGLSGNGDDISLLMTIVNTGDTSAEVNLQYKDADGEKQTLTVRIPANTSVHFGAGGDEEDVVLRNAGATLGGLVDVYVQYGSETGKQLQVPVLDGSIAEYGDLLPGPAPTPTPEPSETPAP